MVRKKAQRWMCWIASMGLGAFPLEYARAERPANELTRSETIAGWKSLFDGKSTAGWRNYRKEEVSPAWKVVDGAIVRDGNDAGDIITTKKYKYFEFMVDYKISEGGNSGLMFHVNEENGAPWQSGPEIQIQDNVAGHDPQKSGWLYQMFEPGKNEKGTIDATRPVGEWNQLYLKISPAQCEVSMNGVVYYQFKLGDDHWKSLVAKSKFAQFPGFGQAGEGFICLQDHGNVVSFRNIKIRELSADGSAPQPIDGKIDAKTSLAFPKLKWDGWDPIDADGNPDKPLRILELTYAVGVPHRLFAMDQRGLIFSFENRPDVDSSKRFLDIQDRVSKWSDNGANEQGLLGLAFHPKFKENGQFFVSYTKKSNDHSIVARYRVSKSDPLIADPASEEIILDVPQPNKNHNGGPIEFGPDGFLYVAYGDGGVRNDGLGNGQNSGQLLSAILRIDVDTKADGLDYGIPKDNPFVGVEGVRPEIFAHGIRNPWRIGFDKKTGLLWCADVGQDYSEEIDIIVKGGNYGWSRREGSFLYGNRPLLKPVQQFVDPIWEYDHTCGKSITGGRVYNASRKPQLTGKYIYADYVSGTVWALSYDAKAGKATRNELLVEKGIPVLAFGEDQSGEVFFMIDSVKGQCIYRFE